MTDPQITQIKYLTQRRKEDRRISISLELNLQNTLKLTPAPLSKNSHHFAEKRYSQVDTESVIVHIAL